MRDSYRHFGLAVAVLLLALAGCGESTPNPLVGEYEAGGLMDIPGQVPYRPPATSLRITDDEMIATGPAVPGGDAGFAAGYEIVDFTGNTVTVELSDDMGQLQIKLTDAGLTIGLENDGPFHNFFQGRWVRK